MLDIISIGDSTVDVFLDIDEATVSCDIHKEHCQLCFTYADKIPVKKVTKLLAVGNAANNAIGSARLGLQTAIFTILGHDEHGKGSFERFKEEGVKREYIKVDRKKGTNYSTVLNYKGERTILVYHEERKYQLPRLQKAKWVYLTSMAYGSEKIHEPLLAYVKRSGAKLAFNPGTFQMKLGLGRLLPLLSATEILFLNKEEAERLLGREDSIKNLLNALHRKGPKMVVITDGMNGSYAYNGTAYYTMPIFDGPVVERTGAGDSYGTAFVAAIALGKDMSEAMRWGSVNASSVVQYIGAQEGLLTRGKLTRLLKQHPSYTAKEGVSV
ncbi:MAG TPA: carbohydrate kinase family protein [Candidatus Kapabacteria bacterium]|nr:carbohydrate kinase family protein [Candidatus Kapabacteria bacterium]